MSASGRRRSPWNADPITWFTTRWISLGWALYAAVHGAIVLLIPGQLGVGAAQQWLALAIACSAFAVVFVASRSAGAALAQRVAWGALALALGALALSALGYWGSGFRVELWWAPVSVSLLIIALAPYSSIAQLARFGAVSLVVASAFAAMLVTTGEAGWPLGVTMFIAVQQIIIATVGCIAFVSIVTRLIDNWSERPLGVGVESSWGAPGSGRAGARIDAEIAERVDAEMSAHLAAPMAFLRDVLARGHVDEADRERARELAAVLRTELVVAADETWLQRLARGQPIEVDDPDRLAEHLSLPQRTALRAMLDALIGNPDSGFVSGRVELKAADGGTLAVGLSIASTLPEGRRITFLAPYYVTLRSTVLDIRWRNGSAFEVDFAVPIADGPRAPLVQRSPAPPAQRTTDRSER